MEPHPSPELEEQPAKDAAPFTLGAGIDFADPHSRLAPYYLCTSHVVAVILLGMVFVLITHLRIWHTDVWGHLRFGETMVQNRELPTREMFSGDFADQDALYINYQWIAQGGAYWVFDLGRQWSAADAEHRLGGGALLLAAAHAAIIVLRFVILLLAFRRLTDSLPLAVLGVALVFAFGVFCHLCILRPQILGELWFAALLLPLSRPALSRRALLLLPLVMVAWANCHGSFPMGFILLGLFLAGRGIEAAWQEIAAHYRRGLLASSVGSVRAVLGDPQVRRLALAFAISLAAVAVLNPHGPALFLHSWALSNHPNIRFIEEWKPLPLKSAAGYAFLASLLVLIPLVRWSPLRFTPTQVLLLLAFGVQSLLHARVFVWWCMIVVWVALPHLQAVYRRYLPPLLEETRPPDLRKAILAGLCAVTLFLWSGPAQWLVWGDVPLGSKRVTDTTPLKAAAYFREQYRTERELSGCIFTSETLGEYLLWDLRTEPPTRIFCYTHVHLFTPDHWLECMAVKSGDRDWQGILDRHAVDFLIVEPDLHPELVKQVRAAADRWQPVSVDPDHVFVAKRIRN